MKHHTLTIGTLMLAASLGIGGGCLIENPQADAGADADKEDSETGSGDSETGTGGSQDSEKATDTITDKGSETATETGGDSATDTVHYDTETGPETDTDIGKDPETETGTIDDTATIIEKTTDSATKSETETETGTGTDVVMDSDTACRPDICAESPYCGAEGDAVCLSECGEEMLVDDCVSTAQHGSCNDGICGCATGFEGEHCDTCVETNAGVEACDDIDNNCDGTTDEGYNLATDPTRCGGCDNNCPTMGQLWPDFGGEVPANVATIGCENNACVVEACKTGYGDDSLTEPKDCGVTVREIISGVSVNTCALLSNDTVKCWGANAFGELGIAPEESEYFTTPVTINGLSDVAVFASGAVQNCAILSDGFLTCLGQDADGNNIPTPTTVTGISDLASVSLGFLYTCALTTSSDLYCWGRNDYGQLGVDTGGESIDSPLKISAVGNMASVAAGYYHTCAVSGSGTIYCWGSNQSGELGTETGGESRTDPMEVMGVEGVKKVSLGSAHTCALTQDNAVYCWGDNYSGQLGVDTGGESSATPIKVVLEGVVDVDAGGSHTCALEQGGDLYCWGYNAHGELGVDTGGLSLSMPIVVPGIGQVEQFSLGEDHTCALLSDGTVKCWGDNYFGQLGNGERNDSPNPTPTTVQSLP